MYKRVTEKERRCTPPVLFIAFVVSVEKFYHYVRAVPGGVEKVSKCLCINLQSLSPLKGGECTLTIIPSSDPKVLTNQSFVLSLMVLERHVASDKSVSRIS
jgi:hypothetical protein